MFLKSIVLLGILLLSGCTVVTKFETYELSPESNRYLATLSQDGKVEVALYLHGTEKRKLVFPLIYQKAIEKEPYRFAIAINGDLEDIEIIQSKIIINLGEQEKTFVITRQDFEYLLRSDGTLRFYLKPDLYLDYPWKDIKEVEFIFEFYAIKNGVKTRYLARKIFKPVYKTLLDSDAMSI